MKKVEQVNVEADLTELFNKEIDGDKKEGKIESDKIEAEFNSVFGEILAKTKTAKKTKEKKSYEGHRERVYEKIKTGAFETLQDYEVLEIMLFSAYARCDTKPKAKKLIERFGSLQKVMDASRYEIKALGFSDKVASVIEVYRGVAGRYLCQISSPGDYIDTRDKAKRYVQALCSGKKAECVYCIYMDSGKKIIECEKLAQGDSSNVVVYTEELFRKVSIYRAKYIIIGHNHPSGFLIPSHNDFELLEEINKGVMALRCYIYDAIITGNSGVISLAEEGYFRDNEFYPVAKETKINQT